MLPFSQKPKFWVIQIFKNFSIFSGLKSHKRNCQIASTGVLKGVQMALCGIECVKLKTNAVKILGIYFLYNSRLENDKKYMIKVEELLNQELICFRSC